jgi:uncharacterized LabA/DUF88 family protein
MRKRAAFFFDGVFFTKINEAVRGNNQQKNLVVKKFIALVVKEIEHCEKVEIEVKQVDFFKGKFSIKQLEKIYKGDKERVSQHLYNERKLEDILTQNNISIHNQQAVVRKNGELIEKGIDVNIVIEALQIKQVDYFILISGDQDFMPLIKHLRKEGLKTATVEVDLVGGNSNIVKTSDKILPFYDVVINLNSILNDKEKLNELLSF